MRLDLEADVALPTAGRTDSGNGERDLHIVVPLLSGMWMETHESEIWSSKAVPPRAEIQFDQRRLAAMQAAWMAPGGGLVGDKESVSLPWPEEDKAVVRVDCRKRWSDVISEAR